jgi:hypothetical protein
MISHQTRCGNIAVEFWVRSEFLVPVTRTDFTEIPFPLITVAASCSETSASFYQTTRRYICILTAIRIKFHNLVCTCWMLMKDWGSLTPNFPMTPWFFPVSVPLITHCDWRELRSLLQMLSRSCVGVASPVPQSKNATYADECLKCSDRRNDKVKTWITKKSYLSV